MWVSFPEGEFGVSRGKVWRRPRRSRGQQTPPEETRNSPRDTLKPCQNPNSEQHFPVGKKNSCTPFWQTTGQEFFSWVGNGEKPCPPAKYRYRNGEKPCRKSAHTTGNFVSVFGRILPDGCDHSAKSFANKIWVLGDFGCGWSHPLGNRRRVTYSKTSIAIDAAAVIHTITQPYCIHTVSIT
jgi:hypothetical protein